MARKKVIVKKKVGRRTKYDPAIVLPRLEALAEKGLSNLQIAKSFGINESTFYEWQDKYPEFSMCLKRFRGLADIEVENALFKSAVGFDFTEEKYVRKKDTKSGEYKMELVETNKKHVNGSATAQIFYLKNRLPEKYRDKIEQVHTVAADMEMIQFTAKRRENETEEKESTEDKK